MQVNIKLLKDFVSQYNKLQSTYGSEIAKLNGFDDDQLSYTDFIDNFIDKETVADASVDSNANVSRKDIVTLEREMPKPHSKLLAFNKIYYELSKKFGGQTLYLLDEPTTGLYYTDVKKLLEIVHRIVDNGSTVIFIEHNLDVLMSADYIVDLGPEGGDEGGSVVASGTPEEVMKSGKGYTSKFLSEYSSVA